VIENERQYNITRAQLRKLERALAQLRQAGAPPAVHPLLHQAQEAALTSQLDDLRRELGEFEDLRSGGSRTLVLTDISDLPETLIRARIASGLTQRELGEELGLKEQQVQRYEATRYAGASLTRILEVAAALGISLRAPAALAVREARSRYRPRADEPRLRAAEDNPSR
jgi:hypothetical protein